uniref:ATP synthase F(0) complex subunit e, mitochondrial n=1 Tax=Ornithorhynchus anatinus TaxID=9258 RepID=A0A6I8NYY8_ORNAN
MLSGAASASGGRVGDKMVPPVQVSPLIKVNPLSPPRRLSSRPAFRAPRSLAERGRRRRCSPPGLTRSLVSLSSQFGRYSALLVGVVYGAKRYDYLKPRAEEERRVAAEEKKRQDELKRIERELAEANDDSILK